MGIFNKLKNLFNKDKEIKEEVVNQYEKGLTKTKENFVNKLNLLGIKFTKIDDSFYEELEEILIMADIGVKTTNEFMEKLKRRVKSENITDFNYLKEVIVDELFLIYVGEEQLTSKINYYKEGLTTILFVGVNGVGKTTSIAKLAIKRSFRKIKIK